jgi:hypothetical protein
MEKMSKASARFNELKELDAVAYINEDPSKALSTLKDMDDTAYAFVLNVAKASIKNSLKETKTSLPKSTEQTQTNLPKSTEQTKASETILEDATKENEANLAQASASKSNEPKPLDKFMTQILDKKGNKKVK